MNHACVFGKSCLKVCETSLLVKFSRIMFKNVEKATISFLTLVCFDVWTDDVLRASVFSNLGI